MLDLQDLRSAEQLQVDAFTQVPFAGNPAAVVFEHRDEEWMQNVATENNYAETSFLEAVPGELATYKLRW
jgi:PhzF family phenazine biosynthesis protein